MTITYLGHLSVGIKSGDVYTVVNPFDKATVGFNFKKTDANITLISKDDSDCNNVSPISGETYVVKGPGEYEVKGVMVMGYPMLEGDEIKKSVNTIYKIDADGINICHLGALSRKLTDKEFDDIGSVDVLVLPVGDDMYVDTKVATEIINRIEPSYVIPVAYADPSYSSKFANLAPIEKFLESMGASKPEVQSSLKLQPSDIDEEGEGITVVLLEKK